MNLSLRLLRRWSWAALAAGLGAGGLPAQHYLVVEDGGKPRVVQKVAGGLMFYEEDGKLKPVRAVRSGLVKAPNFLPVFVAVRNLHAETTGINLNGGNLINKEFHLRAGFESPYLLEDVFIVLDLNSEKAGKRIHVQEIGTLEPRKVTPINSSVRLEDELGPGSYELHVFSRGLEVFHSGQPWQFREQVLDNMVRQRITGQKEALPKPFIGPVPEYPPSLVKAKLKGEVTVKFRITRLGVVVDPVVEKATDPAFGESALVAVRQWRFLPRVKDGQPVEAVASLPFAFDPGKAPEKN